jgi:S-formylglutathione hydrolase FrmB
MTPAFGGDPDGVSNVTISPVEPRVWRCDFKSDKIPDRPGKGGGKTALSGRFLVVLPEGVRPDAAARLPVVYFLHGLGRNERTLLDGAKGSAACRERLLAARCAVVLPDARAGWYVNSLEKPGERFADYLDDVMRLAEARFPVSAEARRRGIGGWSMGGYGTMFTAVRRPGDFAAAAALIGILDYPRAPIEPKNQNYAVRPCFGTDPAVWRTLNPRMAVARLRETPLFVAFATGAPERQMNEAFIASAREAGCAVETLALPGGHQFKVVEAAFPAAMDFLEKHTGSR